MQPLFRIIAILAIAAGSAFAQNRSLHPRVGELGRIGFPAGSANLAADPNGEVNQQLDEVATWAAVNPEGVIVLDGHADRSGDPASNARLSHDRAVAVRDQLVAGGVSPDQIIIAVFGDKGPRAERSVIIWGTRAGTDAVAARSRGATLEHGLISRIDARPRAQ